MEILQESTLSLDKEPFQEKEIEHSRGKEIEVFLKLEELKTQNNLSENSMKRKEPEEGILIKFTNKPKFIVANIDFINLQHFSYLPIKMKNTFNLWIKNLFILSKFLFHMISILNDEDIIIFIKFIILRLIFDLTSFYQNFTEKSFKIIDFLEWNLLMFDASKKPTFWGKKWKSKITSA